ncbi:MAG: hypothetical protein RL701_4366, partial [Pseudomonadota bacterium]
MSSRSGSCIGLWTLALALTVGSTSARAEEPDQRDIPPFVMLVTDTSGSMEYLPGCKCTTKGCTECLPDCALSNLDPLNLPKKKNRWSMVLEALTGQFIDYQCLPLERTVDNGMTYDLDYSLPYTRPWVCPNGDRLCAYPGTDVLPIQRENGLLDNYNGRIRFGLATFDGMRTYTGASDLVYEEEFNVALSNGAQGSYSYGGGKRVHYPGCAKDYMIDSGIRSPTAPEGGLISLNSNNCTNPPCDI